jgi:YidC/Oxa1 family membrane protein insertase
MIDRNQLTGILLIMGILLSWQFFMAQKDVPIDPKREQFIADSIKKATIVKKVESSKIDSAALIQNAGDFALAAQGQSQELVLENKDIKVTLSSKGGAIKKVELKNYKTYNDFEAKRNIPLVVFKDGDKLGFELPTQKGNIDFSSLFFTGSKVGNSIKFDLKLADNQIVSQEYKLGDTGFTLDYNLKLNGLDGTLKNEPVKFNWVENVSLAEKDIVDNRQKSTVNYQTTEGEKL